MTGIRGVAGVVDLSGRPEPAGMTDSLVAAMTPRTVSTFDLVRDQLWIAADVRIDNRGELRSALRLSADTDDQSLVAAAYERWGEHLADHLIGDFAVAILDRRIGRLLLVRDFLGARPLAYAVTPRMLAFASEPQALVQLEDVDPRADPHMIGCALLDWWDEDAATDYAEVRRVPAGHVLRLSLDTGSLWKRRYWAPDPSRRTKAREPDLIEEFRHLMFEAVRCRMPATGVIGTDLSGGLDSSTVTSIAARLGGDGVVAVASHFRSFDDGRFDESSPRRSVAALEGVSLTEIGAEDACSELLVDEVLRRGQMCDAGALIPLSLTRYRAAAECGAQVVLDGYDGDTGVNLGLQTVTRHLLTGRWITLSKELRAGARAADSSIKRAIHDALWVSLVGWGRYALRLNAPDTGLANPTFVREVGLVDEIRRERIPFPGSPAREAAAQLTQGWPSVGMEARDRAGVLAGVDVRHPFYDRRLVEFCMALPPDMLHRGGLGRWVLRESMRGTLPDEVRARNRKGTVSPGFVFQYADALRVGDLAAAGGGGAAPFVDVPRLRAAGERLKSAPNLRDAFALLQVDSVDRSQRIRW